MLFLFNSATRPKYVVNVLNTFCLDTGCINEYRYSVDHVDPQIVDKPTALKGHRCLITYIDRHSGTSFVFHPIREATYLDHEVRVDQIYFRVRLGRFVYPREIGRFQTVFASHLGQSRIPRMANADPEANAEGFFALLGTNLTNDLQHEFGDVAWKQAVEAVANTKIFQECRPVFFRLSLHKLDGRQEKRIPPSVSGQQHYYRLLRDTRYQIQAYYRFPHYRSGTVPVTIAHPDIVSPLSNAGFDVSSRNCTEYFNFKVRRYIEDRDGAFALADVKTTNKQSQGVADIVLPNMTMSFRVGETRLFWPTTAALLLAWSLLELLGGTDFGKLLEPLETAVDLTRLQELQKAVLGNVQSHWLVVKTSATLFKAFVLFLLIRMMGKKVV